MHLALTPVVIWTEQIGILTIIFLLYWRLFLSGKAQGCWGLILWIAKQDRFPDRTKSSQCHFTLHFSARYLFSKLQWMRRSPFPGRRIRTMAQTLFPQTLNSYKTAHPNPGYLRLWNHLSSLTFHSGRLEILNLLIRETPMQTFISHALQWGQVPSTRRVKMAKDSSSTFTFLSIVF